MFWKNNNRDATLVLLKIQPLSFNKEQTISSSFRMRTTSNAKRLRSTS
nr:MAG TPA: hypothetical protein [Caudoviricetes sp.]